MTSPAYEMFRSPWTLDQVRDWPGGPVRWQLTLDVTAAQARAIGAARDISWLRDMRPYDGTCPLTGIDVSVAEATAIANGVSPMAVLAPGHLSRRRLVIRPLTLAELTA